jgi:hypothetical protein
MTNEHPSDEILQGLVLSEEHVSSEVKSHMASCGQCQAAVQVYRHLFISIGKLQAPVFDFDVCKIVSERLAERKKHPVSSHLFVYLLAALFGLAIIIPLYIFKSNMINLFSGTSDLFLFLMLLSAGALILFRGYVLVRKFQQQFRVLKSFK